MDERQSWYVLAIRHLRMARRLLRSGFTDGAIFHTYHAYECVLSSLIASRGHPVPPLGKIPLAAGKGQRRGFKTPAGVEEPSTHKARLLLFDEFADRGAAYYAVHAKIRRWLTTDFRNDALYYDSVARKLPHEGWTGRDADRALVEVRAFAQDVWRSIRR